MSIKHDHEEAKRAIEKLFSNKAYSPRDIILSLSELEDYASIRIEGLEKQIEAEEKRERAAWRKSRQFPHS